MLPVSKWKEVWTRVDYQALRPRFVLRVAALALKPPRIKDTGVFVNGVVEVPEVRACADIASSGDHCPIREHEVLEGLAIYRGCQDYQLRRRTQEMQYIQLDADIRRTSLTKLSILYILSMADFVQPSSCTTASTSSLSGSTY